MRGGAYPSVFLVVALHAATAAQASTYLGNGNSGFGGAIGLAEMEVYYDDVLLTIVLTNGGLSLSDHFVLYFDSVAAGFSSTRLMTDEADSARRAVSGGLSSHVDFPGGFTPDFAISYDVNLGGSLYQLVEGGPHVLLESVAPPSSATALTHTLSVTLSALGIAAGEEFLFVGTYLSGATAFRSDEAFGGGIPPGNPGESPVAFSTPLRFGPTRLNEVRIDQPGADDDEYFEIAGPSSAILDSCALLVLGDAAGSGSGVIEAVVPLDGTVIPDDGFLLVAESSFTLDVADLQTTLNFENLDNVTYLLVWGFTGILGADLDTDDDGVLDSTPWAKEIDRIAFIAEENPPISTEFHYGPPTLGPTELGAVPGHAIRCPDQDGVWTIADVDPAAGTDTPGAANDSACWVFRDGFETGDVSAWSNAVP